MRYEIRYPLESGRNIRVYLATDRWNSGARRVFTRMPFLNGNDLSRAALEDLFHRRRSLGHPSLVQLCDLAFRGKQVGLISEFIDGTPLPRLDGRSLSVGEASLLAMQLVRLMAFLHSRDFLCGSLQPSQLFVRADHRLVVNLLIPTVAFPPQDGDWIRYVAPEILEGGSSTVRGDVFSLGMVFYRLLTGHSPYLERDPDALRKKQLMAFPLTPRRINPDIPSKIEGLIMEMIQKDPGLRPPTLDYVESLLGQSIGSTPRTVPSFRPMQVGRRCEMDTFRDYYAAHLVDPSVRFAIIHGISGIGKTTLMESFRTIVQLRKTRTYSLRHHPGGSDLQALSRLRCQLMDEGMAPTSVPANQDAIQGRPIEFGVELARMLMAVAKRGPVALCVDDLQWMDEGSFAFYRTLAEMGEMPLIVIGAVRSDGSPGHWGQVGSDLAKTDRLVEFRLAPLRQQDVSSLLTNLLGQRPVPELYMRVWSQCGGHPFYILEYLRLLRQEGGLVYQSGRWDWQPAIGRPIVASTVVEAIHSRLSKIAPHDLKILKYLSVMRMPPVLDWLATVLETRIGDLEHQLVQLERLDFVSISGSLEQPVVHLIHDCVRGAIAKQLRFRELKKIHRSLAAGFRHRYLKSHHPLLRQECVFHALVGGEAKWAREYLWKAVEWLENARLYREAADLMERAVRSGVVSRRTWKVVHKTVELFFLSGQLDKCADLCREYLVHPQNDIRHEAAICAVVARVNGIRGQPEEQLSVLRSTIVKLKNVPQRGLLIALEADLLGCLTRQGKFAEAEPIKRGLLKVVKGGLEDGSIDKIYHALGHHAEHTGDVRGAILWESKAIRHAWELDDVVTGSGRQVNLATFHLLIGHLARGRQLAEYSLRTAEEIGNRELALFARCARCLHARKEGRHGEALAELGEVSGINRDLNQNLHAEAEISIELAKNYNYLLLPQDARPFLDKADELLKREYVHPSFVDAKLARGWNWILMGRPERVAAALSPLDPSKIPAERTNYHLLLSHTQLLLGDYKGAGEEAKAAGDGLSVSMLYYQARVHFARARALLAQGRLGEAEPYLREGLSLSKDGFFYPLMVQAWTLLSRWLLLSGDPSRARSHSLRALHMLVRVDRPGLRAEVLWNLGRAEAGLGNRVEAVRRYSQAMQILQERLFHLSPERREPFRDLYIRPIESDRSHLSPPHRSQGHDYFSQLHELAQLVCGGLSQVELGERMFEVVTRSLPSVSANLWLRDPGGLFRITKSRGHCRKSGKHLLNQEDHVGPWLVAEEIQDYPSGPSASIGIPLCRKEELVGLLYLEPQGSTFSEDAVDFLKCMGGVSEVRLPETPASMGRNDPTREGLRVGESRVIVGRHPLMQRLFEDIHRVAPYNTTVLIFGESGTGKELVARGIHTLGRRKRGPFVAINCSALPEQLIESELFGHARGSFTGAVASKLGLIEAASGGTLFLDEISTMPINAQNRLLRVLQEREVRRLGETKERVVDVRIVAATNQSLTGLIRKREFREDLFHRINVHQISVPPLRDRRSDIPLIVNHFLQALDRRNGVRKRMSKEALARLMSYSYPGNIRELSNLVESSYALTAGSQISHQHISGRLKGGWQPNGSETDRVALILEEFVSGRSNFWEAVRKPFLERELSRREVRAVVSAGLRACWGNYRQVLVYFNLPKQDYKKFLAFLSRHDCKVDFRPFRSGKHS